MDLGEVARMHASARAAWPEVEVSCEELTRYLEALEAHADSEIDVGAMCCDVVLACACIRGDTAAITRLETIVTQEVRVAHARVRCDLSLEETSHLVISRILVADDAVPKLALYRGQGELRAWVRVVATRMLLNVATRGAREKPIDEQVLDAVAEDRGDDPELGYLKRLYRDELKRAFAEAVLSLGTRDRALLKLVLVDRLTVDELGSLYGVHRATAARWVANAKRELEKAIRTYLRDRVKLGDQELKSIVRLVQSQIDLSFSRVFGGA